MDDIAATMKVIRTGAYALIKHGDQALLEMRNDGPYKGMWDLPGLRIEAEEKPEETIKRVIEENLQGSFDTASLKYVWTATFKQENFILHQIAIIYEIEGYEGLSHEWRDLSKMQDSELAPLALNAKLIK